MRMQKGEGRACMALEVAGPFLLYPGCMCVEDGREQWAWEGTSAAEKCTPEPVPLPKELPSRQQKLQEKVTSTVSVGGK